MKKLITTLFLLFSFHSYADCDVYIPEKSFLHDSGYSLSFDFYPLLEPKGYTEVYYPEEAHHVLRIKGIEVEGRFHKAQAEISLGEYKAVHAVTCFTQFCALNDYAKAFNKAYKKLKKVLPRCEE